MFKRTVDVIIHFGTERHKSYFTASEASDIKSVMKEYGEATECHKAVGEWLCGYAEHRQPFDQIKHRHPRNEDGDVAEGRYERHIKKSRMGRSL